MTNIQQNQVNELHNQHVLAQQQDYYKVHKIETDSGTIELSMAQIRDFLVAPDVEISVQELKMFLGLCQYQKLNPFIKDAYLIKFSNKQPASIVVSKDVAFKRAFANPNYDGMESGIVVLNKETGQLEQRKGTLYIKSREELVGAWATVWRKDIPRPTEVVVNFDEYVQLKDGKPNTNWSKRPAIMIHKVAESTALRKAFPDTHQGMYDESEVSQPIEVQSSSIIEGQIAQIKQPVIEASITPQQVYQESLPVVENGNDIF
ncbi:phage recombination protein Bet [Turicibacter sanguinis]|uniref:phage recombination protein Bet n=1 Tax=Turicibacter sanguinis TaxID=154288 RepID=UPI0006C521BF|nr:phage recombination protein Bet [Turicibacter sanguinis]MDB8438623.1 phage recombination protein Bet [Turicibacter sanguinis]MTO25218.1 phage recombination protein Bet [Turicibacter sanguinis]MTO28114.1 phage recombination protein Bet [Turicibacter sanguinis]MTO91052.1 phage recombination protein Bet [Turicibacter sanguinis]MTP71201.1 phage recombination protein Bet [Turicibacter sanguinis]